MQTTADEVKVERLSERPQLPSRLRLTMFQRHSRLWMAGVLVLSDLIGFLLASACGIAIRAAFERNINLITEYYAWLVPTLLMLLGGYFWRGLYPATGLSPVAELRKVTESTAGVFLVITATTFWVHSATNYSRLVIAISWLFAFVTIPAMRGITRSVFIRLGLWGEPVAIIGYGSQGQYLVEFLNNHQQFGFRPVVIVDGFDTAKTIPSAMPMLRLDCLEESGHLLKAAGIRTAFLITSDLPAMAKNSLIEQQCYDFHRLIMIPDLQLMGTVGGTPYDFQGILGLDVRQNLLSFWQQTLKRIMDITIVIFGGILISPALLLIAILIRLDSSGGAFYSQQRVGRGGRIFRMWKFRTMVANADQILSECLAKSPALRDEWEKQQKLKDDPRITRVGKILRKWSLDEFPQIYNVLKGEMSLVGPRPFFQSQHEKYGQTYNLYIRVNPGMTGLWQVSGRNNATFAERAEWDEYYVRQWSIWLDIYLLVQTVWVVIKRDGAF